jgi:hypothetical protein
MKKIDVSAENVGVINPYALAEVILRHKIDWTQVDSKKVLADALGMPYEQLFDPKFASPLYAGLKLNAQTLEMERVEVSGLGGIPVVGAPKPAGPDGIVTDADGDPEELGIPHAGLAVSAGAVWMKAGQFFVDGANVTDPVQGAFGDCYFIAALASVAWARTYDIAHRSRSTSSAAGQYVDMVPFYDYSSNLARVEVSELLPLNPPANGFIYARSSTSGEVWPAIYEKAYAKWRTNDSGDMPNYGPIAGGDPVGAAAQLTGLKRYYYWTSSMTADEIWQQVRANSLSCKTFNPMVAWTYSSGDASPDKVNYDNAHLAANHAYSVLGWDYRNNQKYLILRNPWGTYEAVVGVLGGQWSAWDAPYYGGPGWWRPFTLATVDGVFGIRADVFKQYFAGFGCVK